MDDIEQKREAIRSAYSSVTWKNKVDKMSTAQVIAVYIRLRNQGKLGRAS